MPALDTSILVRHLVEDDARQAAAARRLLRAAVASGQALFVPVTVTLELEWVLRKRYGMPKGRVIAALSALLSAADLALESEGAIEGALALYADGGAGFSDCLHVALAFGAGQTPWWTFDRRAARLPGARRLADG
ncbi:MAG: PIN domain-containing protein [Steroidobacteraceae bacterium]